MQYLFVVAAHLGTCWKQKNNFLTKPRGKQLHVLVESLVFISFTILHISFLFTITFCHSIDYCIFNECYFHSLISVHFIGCFHWVFIEFPFTAIFNTSPLEHYYFFPWTKISHDLAETIRRIAFVHHTVILAELTHWCFRERKKPAHELLLIHLLFDILITLPTARFRWRRHCLRSQYKCQVHR